MTIPPASSYKGSSRHAAAMLVLTCLLWGLSFPLMKNWQDASGSCPGGKVVAALTVIALRMFAGLVIFAATVPRLFAGPTGREHAIGMLIGFVNFLGFSLQVVGLSSTTPALSGFLTSLCSAWVPLLAWLCFRIPVGIPTFVGLLIGLAGATCLSLGGDSTWSLEGGESLTFIASIFFAVAVLMLDRLGRRAAPGHLTVGFLAGTGFSALFVVLPLVIAGPWLRSWADWTVSMLGRREILFDVTLLTFFCTVLTFHWMTTYQPQVSAGRAALIYLLEPVFASFFSLMVGLDTLTVYLVMGGLMILAGNALVEVPVWLREWSQPRAEADKLTT